jgi:nitric oxide reductase NorD protein
VPQAEQVLTDAARQAGGLVQELWRRRPRGKRDLPDMLRQLEAVISSAFGMTLELHLTRPPGAAKSRSRRLFASEDVLVTTQHGVIPATDGRSLWLPVSADEAEVIKDFENLRVMALQQAARAYRGSMVTMLQTTDPLVRAIYEVLEADAADIDLATRFRGLTAPLNGFRRQALELRPKPADLAPQLRPLEQWVQEMLEIPCEAAAQPREHPATRSLQLALELAPELLRGMPGLSSGMAGVLHRDLWTGELRPDPIAADAERLPPLPDVGTPDVKASSSDGAVPETAFGAAPLIVASDELQGPPWINPALASDEGADDLAMEATQPLVVGSSLNAAPADRESALAEPLPVPASLLSYPEWDYRTSAYSDTGVSLRLLAAQSGPEEWVDTTLDQHHTLAQGIRQRFEALRIQRQRPDEVDMDARVAAFGDVPARLPQTAGEPAARAHVASLLLIEIGATAQEWVSSTQQLLDLQREALLLACLGLYSLGEPYSVFAVASDGAQRPSMRCIKGFDESYSDDVARRIAGLSCESPAHTGAALRHATALLAQQAAQHRMLLLLSDGAPNSATAYQGRYGIEDMRQAVREARMQGISSLCFSTDQLTGNHLPGVFGEQQSTVLYRPELLPSAFTQWLHRLMRR